MQSNDIFKQILAQLMMITFKMVPQSNWKYRFNILVKL